MTKKAAPPKDVAGPKIDWKNPDYSQVFAERTAWLKRIRASRGTKDDLLPGLLEFYAENPVEFITDWGMTFDPRLVALKKEAVMPFVLFERQEQFIDWLVERWRGRESGLVEKTRDMGVTWLCVGFAVWMWRFHPESVIGFGSRKAEYVDKPGDMKSIFMMIRLFIDLLPPEFRPKGYDAARHAPKMLVVNPENGSRIIGEAGDNIGRGARASLYFVDEKAFIEHGDMVDAALSMTTDCQIDVSTANGTDNAFYATRASGRVPIFTFHWRQDPRKDEAWYAKQKKKLTKIAFAQEVDIDYNASTTDTLIPGEIVDAAMARGPKDVQAVGPLVASLDVARGKEDENVLTLRRGRVVIWQRYLISQDSVVIAQWVKMQLDPYGTPDQIAVDAIGVGGPTADILRRYYPAVGNIPSPVVDVNVSLRMEDGRHFNLRAAASVAMRDWLTGNVVLPNDPDLKTQLCATKYGYKENLLLLEKKEEVKKRLGRSPDRADSLMLGFALPVAERPKPRKPVPAYRPLDAGVGLG